jgi:hypothetical protein
MQEPVGLDRTSKLGAWSLEEEVAAWRSKRALRPRATIGSVRVVRIPKRAASPSDRSTNHALRAMAR